MGINRKQAVVMTEMHLIIRTKDSVGRAEEDWQSKQMEIRKKLNDRKKRACPRPMLWIWYKMNWWLKIGGVIRKVSL